MPPMSSIFVFYIVYYGCILVIFFSYWSILQEWLGRAINWAKFSATAGLGVIHRGHLQQGRALMAPYLPQNGAIGSASPYSEGGALYALGLIHAKLPTMVEESKSFFVIVFVTPVLRYYPRPTFPKFCFATMLSSE